MSVEEYTKEELGQEILDREQEIQAKDKQIASLERYIYKLEQAIIGHRSEKNKPEQAPAEQTNLFGESYQAVEGQTSDTPVKERKRKSKGNRRRPIPADLPRRTTRLEPEVDTSEMDLIEVVVHEKLTIIPAQLIVERIERPKYVDREGNMHIAPYDDPLPKCNMAPSLVAHIINNKYQHHLPLFRQVKIFKQYGVKLARSTLSDAVMRVGHKLQLLHDLMLHVALNSAYLMADESSIPVLTQDKPGSALKGCMLAMLAVNEGLVLFDYIQTKHKVNIVGVLKSYRGRLHVDGNRSYEALTTEEGIKDKEQKATLMNCWVHARRYFVKAKMFDPARSTVVLDRLSEVYRLEQHMVDQGYHADQIRAYRKRYTKPILRKIYNYCQSQYYSGGHTDPFQEALRYTLKRWIPLNRFLGDGTLKLDTNLLENKIRPLAIGRKNYLFCGSHQGAKVAATIYSIIGTSTLHGHDPEKVLQQIIQRIDNQPINKLHQLIPNQNFVFK